MVWPKAPAWEAKSAEVGGTECEHSDHHAEVFVIHDTVTCVSFLVKVIEDGEVSAIDLG